MESPIIAQLPRGHRMDRQFGVVYDSAPTRSDDLTAIEGIRTREAVLLNQRGIYFFGQVALWRHREVVEIARELQLPVSRIMDEGWIQQAVTLSTGTGRQRSAELPASLARTVCLLTMALFVSFCLIFAFGSTRNAPLTGVLSADITSIRVPAPSRVRDIHVRAGQEVFSGQSLLTLEKLDNLGVVEQQERMVRHFELDLRRVEAQARMEIEWREAELDRELALVRQQVAQRCAVVAQQMQNQRQADAAGHYRDSAAKCLPVSPVSTGGLLAARHMTNLAGGLMFFSGSGQVSPPATPRVPLSPAIRVAEKPSAGTMLDVPKPLFSGFGADAQPEAVFLSADDSELARLRQEETRLTTLRNALSQTVGDALGVPLLRVQHDETRAQLETMKCVNREMDVKAPVYGVVGQVRYRPGDDIPDGEIMLRILHTDRRFVVVHVPTRRVHELQNDQEVGVIFPGGREYRGIVVDVPMMVEANGNAEDAVAAIRIEPVGRLWPMIPIGAQVDVVSTR